MKLLQLIFLIFYLIGPFITMAQFNNSQLAESINGDGSAPDPTAILDLQSDSKGVLIPRMDSTDRKDILNPANGLLVFDTATSSFWYHNGSWIELSTSGYFEKAGNVIRGTGDYTEDFVFGKEALPGATGTFGGFFYDSSKYAFRTGFVDGDDWASENIGEYSIAFNKNTNASGDRSAAFGNATRAIGDNSVSFGRITQATGLHAASFGSVTTASGAASTAFGLATDATGAGSVSFGSFTAAIGVNTASYGFNTDAEAYASMAIGRNNISGGDPDFWQSDDPVFEIGIGTDTQRANAVTVLKNGKTGIGTSTPEVELATVGLVRAAHQEEETNYVEIGHDGSRGYLNTDGAGHFDINHNDQTILTVATTQNVGIRTPNPSSDLHISHGSNAGNDGMRIENDAGNENFFRFYIVNSSGHLRLYSDDSASSIGYFDDASGSYFATSDRRKKTGIEALDFTWEQFHQLKPSTYIYKSDEKEKERLGLIAQETEGLFPQLVSYDAEADAYHLDYGGIGVLSVKAIQKQQLEIDMLADKLKKTEEENRNLLKLILSLEEQMWEMNKKMQSCNHADSK